MNEKFPMSFNQIHFLRYVIDNGYLASITGSEAKLLLLLVRRSNLKGQSWLSLSRLCRETGLSRPVIQKCIKNLRS